MSLILFSIDIYYSERKKSKGLSPDFAFNINPAGNYMFKVDNRNTRTKCGICSKLTLKTPEQRHWRRSDAFIVIFEHISHLVLVFIVNFEQVNAGWGANLREIN